MRPSRQHAILRALARTTFGAGGWIDVDVAERQLEADDAISNAELGDLVAHDLIELHLTQEARKAKLTAEGIALAGRPPAARPKVVL